MAISAWKKRFKGKSAADLFLLPALILSGIVICTLLWEFSSLSEYASPQKLAAFAASFRQDPRAPYIMVALIIAGQMLFFPLSVMTLATAMVFGPLEGILISVTGGIAGAAVTYGIGKLLGEHGLRRFMGPVCQHVRGYINDTGLLGMIALRYIPVAPYSVVNVALGVLSVPFRIFMAGSFFALIPGAVIRSFLGGAVVDLWQNPDSESLTYVGGAVFAWLAVIVVSHILARKLPARTAHPQAPHRRVHHA